MACVKHIAYYTNTHSYKFTLAFALETAEQALVCCTKMHEVEKGQRKSKQFQLQ